MENLLLSGFLAVAAFTLYEIYISSKWNARYFTSGLSLFASEIRLGNAEASLPDVSYLEARHSKNIAVPRFEFRSLDAETIAFREKMIGFSLFNYPTILRGVIRIDIVRRKVTVHGYMIWYMLVIGVIWCSIAAYSGDPGFALFLVVFESVLYGIQAARFNRVARTLEKYYSPGAQSDVRVSR